MTKKEQKEQNKKNRTLVLFNTGTRAFKSAKDYNRKKVKENTKKLLTEWL